MQNEPGPATEQSEVDIDEPIDELIDELFVVEPEQFTATRNLIVKRLKVEKRKDEAAVVAALTRPTASVWAMNQVVRAHIEVVAELLSIGAEAIATQEAVLNGGPMSALQDVLERRRVIVTQLVQAAIAQLSAKSVATDSLGPSLRTGFEVASVDEEFASKLRVGRLTSMPQLSTVGEAPPQPKKVEENVVKTTTRDSPSEVIPPSHLSLVPPLVDRHAENETNGLAEEVELSHAEQRTAEVEQEQTKTARAEQEQADRKLAEQAQAEKARVYRVAQAQEAQQRLSLASDIAEARFAEETAASTEAVRNIDRIASNLRDVEKEIAALVQRAEDLRRDHAAAVGVSEILEERRANAEEQLCEAQAESLKATQHLREQELQVETKAKLAD